MKRRNFACRTKQGSILLYTLCIFMIFLTWFEMMLVTKINHIKQQERILAVHKRLDIQGEIVSYYKVNCKDAEDSVFPEGEFDGVEGTDKVVDGSDACQYEFELHGEYVRSEKRDNVIYTDIGDGRLMFKYDIMGDGSYKQTIMEE